MKNIIQAHDKLANVRKASFDSIKLSWYSNNIAYLTHEIFILKKLWQKIWGILLIRFFAHSTFFTHTLLEQWAKQSQVEFNEKDTCRIIVVPDLCIKCQMFTLVYKRHRVLQSYRYFTEYLFASDRAYSTALVGVCDSGLAGLIILLISSAISGFLFTTLVWCNSHTWIYFKHKGRYIKVSHCIYYNIQHQV